MSHERHVLSKHPLKMGFAQYLRSMDDAQLERRLGAERAEAFRNGELDASRYISPPRGERYRIEDLRNDDIGGFAARGAEKRLDGAD